jgi:hypothetical protein
LATDWAAGPNDGYFFEWFLHHLAGSGDAGGAMRLLFDPGWMLAKLRAVGLHAVIADYGEGLGDDSEAELEVREALLHAAPAILSAPDHLWALLADRLPDPVRPSTAELAGRLRSAVPSPRFRLLGRSLAGRSEGLIVTVPDVGRDLPRSRSSPATSGSPRHPRTACCGHSSTRSRLTDEVHASGALLGAWALPGGRTSR